MLMFGLALLQFDPFELQVMRLLLIYTFGGKDEQYCVFCLTVVMPGVALQSSSGILLAARVCLSRHLYDLCECSVCARLNGP